MINRVVLIGRLTRDPEYREIDITYNVAHFSLAVDKRVKPTDGSPTANFFRVTCWGKTAEIVVQYFNKGRLVAVDGRLESRRFTDKNGQSREVYEIVADTVVGLDRPKDPEVVNPAEAPVGQGYDDYDPFAGDE